MHRRFDLFTILVVAGLLAGPGQSGDRGSQMPAQAAPRPISRKAPGTVDESGGLPESVQPGPGERCGALEIPFVDCQENALGGVDYVFPGGRIISCRPNAVGGQDCW